MISLNVSSNLLSLLKNCKVEGKLFKDKDLCFIYSCILVPKIVADIYWGLKDYYLKYKERKEQGAGGIM